MATPYTSVVAAIAAASTGDTIYLISQGFNKFRIYTSSLGMTPDENSGLNRPLAGKSNITIKTLRCDEKNLPTLCSDVIKARVYFWSKFVRFYAAGAG